MLSKPQLDYLHFATESNQIESIWDDNRHEIHHRELMLLLTARTLTVDVLRTFVAQVAGALLRTKKGMDVRVGSHLPPAGGPLIEEALTNMLRNLNEGLIQPYQAHLYYEDLHPFMDGNGRSGRALWLWAMLKFDQPVYQSSFLQTFYYQTLHYSRKR